MPEFDTLIKGGMVIDGSRSPRYRGDIAIKDGLIAEIGHIDRHRANQALDADGLIVAPGFVDLHTHYDAAGLLGSILHDLGLAWHYHGRDR